MFIYVYLSDQLLTGIWAKAETLADAELNALANSLPCVMEAGLARATNDKYQRAWKKWTDWASNKSEICVIPGDPFFIAIYLNHLLQTMKTVGAIRSAINGIAWAHHMAGYASPTEDPFVKLTAKGCERLLGKPVSKSEPLTSPIIKTLVDEYRTVAVTQNMPAYRFLLITLICYAGFLRIDELLSTRIEQVHIDEKHMAITLPRCKNDQERKGNVVHIARTSTRYCPVTFTEEFMALAGITLADKQAHLLPRITKLRKGYVAHKTLGISYTTAREVFQKHVQAVYRDGLKYTLHGLRSGGASEAANNGRDGRSISKHGRWKTQKSRNGYIHDSLEKRLQITRSL